jgi:hypothetical protein
MLESLNTGKVYEKDKGYFSFGIDSCWLSSCRMSGKLYSGCSGGDRCAVINLSTYWYKCSVEYKDKRIFLRSACDRRSLLPVNEKTALQGGFFEGSNTCR